MPPLKRQPIRLEDLLGPQGLQELIAKVCKCIDDARSANESGSVLARRMGSCFAQWNKNTFGPVPPVRTLRRINNLVKGRVVSGYVNDAFSRILGPEGPTETFDDLVQQVALQERQEAAIRIIQEENSSDFRHGSANISTSSENVGL